MRTDLGTVDLAALHRTRRQRAERCDRNRCEPAASAIAGTDVWRRRGDTDHGQSFAGDRIVALHRLEGRMAYALPGVPAAALGAYTLVHMPGGWPEMLLGLFIMALVPLRRLVMKGIVSINLVKMAVVGVLIGFLTGLFLSTGPLVCLPFWRSASCAAPPSPPRRPPR
jgi:hypothetical protein